MGSTTSNGGTSASRYVEAHVAKVIECNWKISQEAFCEAYHADTTHPVTAKYIGNSNSQIDVWDNCSRGDHTRRHLFADASVRGRAR